MTGLGLESGLKVCSLELGGCGETCAEEPEDGDIGYSRTSLCGASSIPVQQNNIHNTLYLIIHAQNEHYNYMYTYVVGVP